MKIHSLRALKDNYIFVVETGIDRDVVVIDPSEAAPVLQYCQKNSCKVKTIINTHHHWDHVGGNEGLVKTYNCQVLCHTHDLFRTPCATTGLEDGQSVELGNLHFQVLHIPGHTDGQVALYEKSLQAVFVGDTLFRFGCGRLFEGDAQQMWQSLQKLKSLPADTMVYCGHEYGLRNLEFVRQFEDALPSEDAEALEARMHKQIETTGMAVPFALEEQIQWSPFLKANTATDFARWRKLRDQF